MIRDNTSNTLNVHYDPFYPYNQSFLFFRLIIVYHTSQCRISVLHSFSVIHLPPVEEGEFLLTFVKYRFFILVYHNPRQIHARTTHWMSPHLALQLPDVKTIHPVRRHASVSLLPEY